VLVAPVGSQPLKGGVSMAAYRDRLAMVRLACDADRRLAASDLDAPNPDGRHNYTYETLCGLKGRLAHTEPDARLFCLLGADSFHTLAKWHRARELVLLCDFIVAARPGYDLVDLQQRLPAGVETVHRVERNGLLTVELCGVDDDGSSTLHLMLDLEEDVSATALRTALAEGDVRSSGAMLPAGVAEYIRDHHLYQSTGTGG
jgi:nicotinate-nucleotide adenylyltransferase